jgi:hypothetical protein
LSVAFKSVFEVKYLAGIFIKDFLADVSEWRMT